MDEVVTLSWTVSHLLRIASANRLALGQLDEKGQQTFQLPGREPRETLDVRIEPPSAVVLDDVQ